MRLTPAQLRQLRRDGYVQLPRVVPRSLLDPALHAVNACFGLSRSELCPGDPDPTGIARALDALVGSDAVNDLVRRSPLRSVVDGLLGDVEWEKMNGGWIVLRFPQLAPRPMEPIYHIDGVYTADAEMDANQLNRVKPRMIRTHSMKITIYLADVPEVDSGNFTVIPGSHRVMARHIREHGPEVLEKGMPRIPWGKPRQLVGRAGDAFVCHYLTVHDGGENFSPRIRYAAFFDVMHREHETGDRWKAALLDPWLEWPGVRERRPPLRKRR